MTARRAASQKFERKGLSPTAKADAQSVSVVTLILDFCKWTHPKIQKDDKTPNSDGYVYMLNEDEKVQGAIDVQVKTLRAGKTNFSCPTYLIDYADNNALPFILICVDREKRIGYWKKLSSHMSEYRPTQATFTVHFTEDEIIDERHLFTDRWADMALTRARLPNEMNDLEKALLRDIDEQTRMDLQEFVEVINTQLDANWCQVKRAFFPLLWKFGVLLNHRDPNEDRWQLQVYSVRKGGSAPLVMAGASSVLEESDTDSFGRSLFSLRFTRNFQPVNDAMEFIKSIVTEAFKQRIFEPPNEICLVERAWRAYRTFEAVKRSAKGKVLDIKALLTALSSMNIHKQGFWELDLPMFAEIRRDGLSACHQLLGLGKDKVKYPYVGKGNPVAWVDGAKQSDLLKNLGFVLSRLLPEYQQFLRIKQLGFLGEHWFDQSTVVFFVLKPKSNGMVTYDYHVVEYCGSGGRIRVVDQEQVKEQLVRGDFAIFVDGKKYKLLHSCHQARGMQIFSGMPMRDLLLEFLKDDVDAYFAGLKRVR